MIIDIKACPFCGSRVSVTHGSKFKMPFLFFKCRNKECGATVSFDNELANSVPQTAKRNWNSRVWVDDEE